MEQARFSMDDNQLKDHTIPCRTSEMIHYTYKEFESCSHSSCLIHNETKDVFSIGINIFARRFKEIAQTKAINVETFVGNAGGYIGMFIGCGLLQFPDIVSYFLEYLNKKYLSCRGRGDMKNRIEPQRKVNEMGKGNTIEMEVCELRKQNKSIEGQLIELKNQVKMIIYKKRNKYTKV